MNLSIFINNYGLIKLISQSSYLMGDYTSTHHMQASLPPINITYPHFNLEVEVCPQKLACTLMDAYVS